jgi:hypothetical protein
VDDFHWFLVKRLRHDAPKLRVGSVALGTSPTSTAMSEVESKRSCYYVACRVFWYSVQYNMPNFDSVVQSQSSTSNRSFALEKIGG